MNRKIERLFLRSGAKTKTEFITNCIFDKPFKVVVTDKGAMDISIRLKEIHSQIHLVGLNYNQVTKAVKTAFTDRKALAFIHKLEKSTIELVELLKKVVSLSESYKEKWLSK